MIRYNISNSEIKAIKEYDKAAKDCFPAFYVNYKGEAFAPRKVHQNTNRYSFIRDEHGYLDFLFRILELNHDNVIELYHSPIAKSTTKLSAVEFLVMKHNKVYFELNELKDKNRKGIEEYIEEDGDKIMVHIGTVRNVDDRIKKIYKASYPHFDNIQWQNSSMVESILNKEMVMFRDNNDILIAGKPLFPGINKDTKLGIAFIPYPNNDELFIANIILLREQIYRYHKYIGIRMIDK